MNKFLLLLLTLLFPIAAWAANYDINVGGVEVTTSNYNNVTGGDIQSGTVTYNSSTKTLTLTGVRIERDGGGKYCIHNRSVQGLTVRFVGLCNLTSDDARVIRDQSGGSNMLIATSGSKVNMTSNNDGAIYVRDNTTLTIQGPGTYNIIGKKDGAIAGHGSWNATATDKATKDYIRFDNVTATVTGAQSSLLGLEGVTFYAGSKVTLKATNSSSYPVVRQVKSLNLTGSTAILTPPGATFNSSSESIVLNGSNVYDQNIYISDDYALVINSTNFPDANFRNVMFQFVPKGYLTQSELNDFTLLNVQYNNILDMTGVEKLTALKTLNCYGNLIISLNLSSNTALTSVNCSDNPNLIALNINNCANLETLKCYDTRIKSLTLTNKTKLTTVYAQNNPSMTTATICENSALTWLEIHDCPALTQLNCHSNKLYDLNLNNNTALKTLLCRNNTDLDGLSYLEHCTAMEYLNCAQCRITTLYGCNSMPNLKELYANDNNLSSLTLTNKSKLTLVYVYNNPSMTTADIYNNSTLSTLIISNCRRLNTLNCYGNAFTTLDVDNNTALTSLNCSNNSNLSSIEYLYDCTAMKTLNCSNTSLSNLYVENNLTQLESLSCYSTKLTSLTLTNKSKLTTVYAYNNPNLVTVNIYNNPLLSTLNIYSCPALKTLNCYNDNLSALNLSGNTALTTVRCYSNKFTSLNFNSNTALSNLECFNNTSLTSLSIGSCTNLETLLCYNTGITSLNLGNLNKLKTLNCSSTKLTSLAVTDKPQLTAAHAHENPYLTTANICNNSTLSALNIYNCPALTTLDCHSNNLASLNLSGNTALTKLYCYSNRLTSLDVSALTNLNLLNCRGNQLTALNLTNNTALANLYCHSNSLTSLNVSGKTALKTLWCDSNQLTSLTVQGCSALTELSCQDNKLTSLSVQGCAALRYLHCYQNRITDAGMTTLVGSLPTRSSSSKGMLYALYNTGENNVFTEAHRSTAASKYWTPYRFNGSSWVEIPEQTGPSTDGFLVLPDVTADAGSTVTIPIGINDVYGFDYRNFMVDFYYPEDFEVLGCELGELIEEQVNGTNTQIYSASIVENGRVKHRIFVLNPAADPYTPFIMGDMGTILYVDVWIPANASGEYEISLENCEFAKANYGDYPTLYPDDVTATLTVIGGTQPGDVDGNGVIGMDDLSALINYLLNGNASGIDMAGADVNGTDGVNMDDLSALINYLLTH